MVDEGGSPEDHHPGDDGFAEAFFDDGAVGVMGYSSSWYAGCFYSGHHALRSSSGEGYFAAYFKNRGGDDEPDLRVDGYSIFGGAKTGYVVDICLSAGPEPLETGDVVIVTGFSERVVGDIPVIAVRKATEAESTSVVGVVDLPFVVEYESHRSQARHHYRQSDRGAGRGHRQHPCAGHSGLGESR